MIKAYWNLNRKCWSIMGKDGRIVKHVQSLFLRNCTFVVRPAGREKVLKTRRKNVHAFIKGEEDACLDFPILTRRVRYNPYENPFFTFEDNGQRVDSAALIFLSPKGKAYTHDLRNVQD